MVLVLPQTSPHTPTRMRQTTKLGGAWSNQCHNQDLEASCSTRTIHDRPRLATINRRDLQGACAQSVGSSILHSREDGAPADTSRRTVPLI